MKHHWYCRLCAAVAGSIELGAGGELCREGHTGTLTQRVDHRVRFERLREAIDAGDVAALFALDPELAPWWCPDCAASYCSSHWQRWDVFDDQFPSFRDSIRGRCPHGHERMLED